MKSSFIRVMIADDFEIIRHGIKRILEFEDNIRVVAEASGGEGIINTIKSLTPDILLLDMSMPGYNGLDILKKIKEDALPIKVIMLTIERGIDVINLAIEYGADGYVVKESTTSEIVDAINTVYGGNKYLDKSLVSLIFERYGKKEESHMFDILSEREIDILYCVSTGLSNKEIASKLFLSEKTIKNNLTKLFKKIEVKDRVHAAIFGINNNISEYHKRD